jgi:hypothetical protein
MKSAQINAFLWDIKYHCHHHHHPANMMVGHLLTLFGVTRLERSFMVSPAFFCCRSAVFSFLNNLLWGILFTCCNQFLLCSCILSKTGVTFSSFAISICSIICPSQSQCAIPRNTVTHVQPAHLPMFYFQSYTTCSLYSILHTQFKVL